MLSADLLATIPKNQKRPASLFAKYALRYEHFVEINHRAGRDNCKTQERSYNLASEYFNELSSATKKKVSKEIDIEGY